MTTPETTMAAVQQLALAQLGHRRNVNAVHSIDVIVGGQYGSEAKGHVTQQVIHRRIAGGVGKTAPVLNIRVAGPNAGHTVYARPKVTSLDSPKPEYADGELTAFAFRQLPVGIVEDAEQVFCAIAAGSEIELDVLLAEISEVKTAGLWPAHRLLLIDPEATLLDGLDRLGEADAGLVDRIGSTGKGVGSARSKRIMRTAKRVKDSPEALQALSKAGAIVRPVALLYSVPETQVDRKYGVQYQVVVEGTQGYGLGLHAGHYPQSTSSDCRAIDFLGMAGLSPWQCEDDRFKIWVVVRPHPIRVAGNSGPLHGETTWAELGLPEERTTVTKKVRRVGKWDPLLVDLAVRANGGGYPHTESRVVMALSMADQIDPGARGVETALLLYRSSAISEFLEQIQAETGAWVDLVTTSPSTAVWLGEQEG